MRKTLSLTPLLALLMLAGCATTTNSSMSGVERKQFLMLSEQQVESMSTESYMAALKEANSKKALNTDSKELNRVRTISNRLIAQSSVFRPDAKDWKWEVNVEESDQVNAYCMPGGKIMVFTGLIDKLKATDDELAAVIGHEIAHALREHGRERMSIAAVQNGLLTGLGVLAATSKNGAVATAGVGAAALGANLLFSMPNGREQEREADRIGLELAARAGYNPNAAVTLWQKMSAQSEGAPPEFLSTHPSNENRINDLRSMIPSVMPLYDQAKK